MRLPQSIAVIDDERGVREVYALWLSEFFPSAQIVTKSDFAEPIPPVDVILLDLYLNCPWEDTLLSLKVRRHSLPPVVCMTGRKDAGEVMERCLEAGAQDFISKDRAAMDRTALAEKLTLAYLRHAATKTA